MSAENNLDERLIAPVLRLADQAAEGGAGEPHLDEETLALFAQGVLDEPERAKAVDHLADCPACRQAAGTLMSLTNEAEQEVRPLRRERAFPIRGILVAAAASVLVVVGVVFWGPWRGPQFAERKFYESALALLEKGQFDEVQTVVEEAAAEGIRSDRLINVEAQATLEMRGPVALASSGRLTDFGFEIGGIAARTAAPVEDQQRRRQAHELLAQAESSNVEIRLNRAYLLLAIDRPQDAIKELEPLASSQNSNSLFWLGMGLAHYMLEDYSAAAQGFRRCLELDAQNVAAQINLAMTLEERGELSEALSVWRHVPVDLLSEPEREAISAEIEVLKQHLNP